MFAKKGGTGPPPSQQLDLGYNFTITCVGNRNCIDPFYTQASLEVTSCGEVTTSRRFGDSLLAEEARAICVHFTRW